VSKEVVLEEVGSSTVGMLAWWSGWWSVWYRTRTQRITGPSMVVDGRWSMVINQFFVGGRRWLVVGGPRWWSTKVIDRNVEHKKTKFVVVGMLIRHAQDGVPAAIVRLSDHSFHQL